MRTIVALLAMGPFLSTPAGFASAPQEGPPRSRVMDRLHPIEQPVPLRELPVEVLANAPASLYRGTYVSISEKSGVPLDLQRFVSERLGEKDESPASRFKHFAWLKDRGVWLESWIGSITDARIGGAGFIVEVKFTPRVIDPQGSYGRVTSKYTEYYLVNQEGIHFMTGHGVDDGDRAILFP